MTNYNIKLEKLTKVFSRRLIFKNIDFEFSSPSIVGVTGPNGSGKSTLAKIIAGLISPTSGKISHSLNGESIKSDQIFAHLGFVSPYLTLYDEFTGQENVEIACKVRGVEFNSELNNQLFTHFNIFDRKDEQAKAYSSGMKQRLKYVFSLIHNPDVVIFDEPTSNLDDEGKSKVYETIIKLGKDKLVIVASNEKEDLALCSNILDIRSFKNQ